MIVAPAGSVHVPVVYAVGPNKGNKLLGFPFAQKSIAASTPASGLAEREMKISSVTAHSGAPIGLTVKVNVVGVVRLNKGSNIVTSEIPVGGDHVYSQSPAQLAVIVFVTAPVKKGPCVN